MRMRAPSPPTAHSPPFRTAPKRHARSRAGSAPASDTELSMAKKMLIDAAHPEETRVAVMDGHRVDDFDFETAARRQLRGNIYLAKVTRVEPSLQAAFIDYGGNRHGFLAFSEIHPDYYRIPLADREAIKAELDNAHHDDEPHHEDGEKLEQTGGADDDDDGDDHEERRRRILTRRYRIQEVIKRGQMMLIQVVKEERGNKGAALTTYLSLAGRYCVLMPNTGRGGGISRKITNGPDRKRLKKVATDLDVPQGMGLIIRTAGAKRTKTEIKRDYEYLIRAWENIRDTTMRSIAPALIYEESSLVKRAIRDLYEKDVEEIHVEGEAAYREAKDFVRMLMPSHAKKVNLWKDPAPIFTANFVERQLETIYSPVVNLKSGGYIVINQTEALVSIDVNSGRATREKNIEQTALKTNLEAAEEAARQMRLRDLAGLIVIDFIDMEEARNDRHVEKKVKDCLRFDRARVQMGKISGFGLLEMSRQRRRTGILEGTSHVCPHCQGVGRIRSIESSALRLMRALDEECAKRGARIIEARVATDVALYLLNEKRDAIAQIEEARNVRIRIAASSAILAPDYEIVASGGRIDEAGEERVERAPEPRADARPARGRGRGRPSRDEIEADEAALDAAAEAGMTPDEDDEIDAGDEAPAAAIARDDDGEAGGRNSRRRRGRRGGRRRREDELGDGAQPEIGDDGAPLAAMAADQRPAAKRERERDRDHDDGERGRGRRRRRRRGGLRFQPDSGEFLDHLASAPFEAPGAESDDEYEDDVVEAAPAPAPRAEPPRVEPVMVAAAPAPTPAPVAELAPEPLPEPPAAAIEPEPDYAPDLAGRRRFFERLQRWGGGKQSGG
jgi:ribonuclease E